MDNNIEERYDVIIIGSGPAGLSAAITLKIRNKKILVLGNARVSKKVESAHAVQNYLGLPDLKGSDLAERFLEHAIQMGVEIVTEQVATVYAMGDYFAINTRSNRMFEASSLILATGVSFGKAYPGEENFLGRGVSYCATCDAPFYKGKKVVIIGQTEKEEEEAAFMAEVASQVVYIPLYKELTRFEVEKNETEMPVITVVRDKPMEISGHFKAEKLVLQEQEIEADGFFVLRDNVSPAQMVPGLAVEDNHVTVNRKMETSIEGCFACGDLVGQPYQYIKAAGEGNVAALSAVSYLAQKRK